MNPAVAMHRCRQSVTIMLVFFSTQHVQLGMREAKYKIRLVVNQKIQ
jgi:hypothetical protein